jgi:hypothetical protein
MVLLLSAYYASGQSKLTLFESNKTTMDFNYFVGNDVANFKTTLKGFGSIGAGYEISIVSFGNEHYALFLNLGYSIRYYRFEKNLKLTKKENEIEDEIIENPPYEFKNTFFSWSKNKMVVTYLNIPVGVDLKFRFADFRLQASYNRYLFGKHKLKYIDENNTMESKGNVTMGWLVGEEREKYKTPNKEFKNYFINKNNLTASIEIIPKINGERIFGIGFKYDLLPFFIEGKGADIHATSIFISFF